MSRVPIRVAVIGTGGCAESHHRALAILEQAGHCRVVGTCDPEAHRMPRPRHVREGLKIHENYLAMLDEIDGRADYVVVPTPIHLHAEMHREIIRRGIACYLEKPPTLDPSELKGMLTSERAARHSSFIGFSHIFRPEYTALKTRIVDGEFGSLRELSLLGLSPRVRSYFQRNPWAGKLQWGGRLLLDSCLGNAMAHHVHTLLFWSGPGQVWHWDRAEAVRSHLFRANDIEAPDTVFLEATLSDNVRLRIVVSHACEVGQVVETIRCDLAVIRISYAPHPGISIQWADGSTETMALPQKNAYLENHAWYMDYLRGRRERPCTLLSDCQGMVSLNGLAYLSAGAIVPVGSGAIRPFTRNGGDGFAIVGIERVARAFLDGGGTPDIPGRSTSTSASQWVSESDMPGLSPLVDRMTRQRSDLRFSPGEAELSAL